MAELAVPAPQPAAGLPRVTISDPRHTDLYVSAATWLTRYRLHPDPAGYLAHGYVSLCLAAWPGALGRPLDLATRWALLTWLIDDEIDGGLRDATPEQVRAFTAACAGATEAAVRRDAHPLVRALGALAGETCAGMPGAWWERYRRELVNWLGAAQAKLLNYVQPERVPTPAEYLAARPADGGMLLAAMWCELAEQCVTPEWRDPTVQSLLGAWSACGTLANDLAARADEAFAAPVVLEHSQGLSAADTRERVADLLRTEEHRFRWLCTVVRSRGFAPETVRFVSLLDQFRVALTAWTAASSRYVLAGPGDPR